MTPHQVSVAAEAYAACLLAQCGFNISVQYGANQPEYDLLVERQPPFEIKQHLKTQNNGKGHLALAEDHLKYHPKAKRDDKIPSHWKFSEERVNELIGTQSITSVP